MSPKGEHMGYNLRNRRMVGMLSVSCVKHNGGTNIELTPNQALLCSETSNWKLWLQQISCKDGLGDHGEGCLGHGSTSVQWQW